MSQSIPFHSTDQAHRSYDLQYPELSWRMVSIRQWLRGWKLTLLILLAAAPGVSVALLETTAHWRHAELFQLLMLTVCPSALGVLITAITFDGPRGMDRLKDFATVPGGPKEFARGLVFASRIWTLAIVAIWILTLSVSNFGRGIEIFPLSLSYAWCGATLAATSRFWLGWKPFGTAIAMFVAILPGGLMIEGIAGSMSSRCGCSAIAAVMDAYLICATTVFGGSLAIRSAISRLSNVPV